MSYLISTS